MATIKLSNEAATLKAQAIKDALAGGILRIYTTPTPTNADDAHSGTILSQHTLPSPAFGTVSNGVMTANTINDENGLATGSAANWRAFGAGSPENVICQGTVGVSGSGASLIINSTAVVAGGVVTPISWVYSQPKG